jgi:hypothetical protein
MIVPSMSLNTIRVLAAMLACSPGSTSGSHVWGWEDLLM